jgi:hypothetical protein
MSWWVFCTVAVEVPVERKLVARLKRVIRSRLVPESGARVEMEA